MRLISKSRRGSVYHVSNFKTKKALNRITKELDKAGYTYEVGKARKTNTFYLIINDVTSIRISNHTERSKGANHYKVLNYREVKKGMVILERVNVLSNEDMFEFIDYLRKNKRN